MTSSNSEPVKGYRVSYYYQNGSHGESREIYHPEAILKAFERRHWFSKNIYTVIGPSNTMAVDLDQVLSILVEPEALPPAKGVE